jgi:hypothetical protein
MQRNDLLGVLVASFRNRACADEAVRDLHHAGTRHTWLGVARSDGGAAGHERVEDAGISHVVARWLRHDRDETLYEALCEHGVAYAEAHRLDGTVPDGDCVLVVEDVLYPAAAAAIAVRHGGTLLVVPDEIDPSMIRPMRDPMADTRLEAARRHPARQAIP